MDPIQIINRIPWVTFPDSWKTDEYWMERQPYFWWRQLWHFIGGNVVGLAALIASLALPEWNYFYFGAFGGGLTFGIIGKEIQ